jgi:hypothetical protein
LKSINADAIPSRRAMLLQIRVAMKAMPWYSLLPTISEYLTEIGWTKSFPRINNVGWVAYVGYLAIYMVIVEFGIYWMHRELHDIIPLYKYLHATHHIYNKQNTLSPFAGEYVKYSIFQFQHHNHSLVKFKLFNSYIHIGCKYDYNHSMFPRIKTQSHRMLV